VSFSRCSVHVEPERVYTYAAPMGVRFSGFVVPSPGAPISAVLPSAESATLSPEAPL
jgi:hypothetical protein